MASTTFTVDLGNLKLTAAQTNSINAAIQKAVSAELASVPSSGRIALIPINVDKPGKYPWGGWIRGIIARPIGDKQLNEIIGM